MAVELSIDASRLDALFADIDRSDLPGAAIGVARGGTPLYRRGFGLASLDQPVLLSPTTRMRIASLTKHFTSLAYLLLCEDGKAALDDPVTRHLPEFTTGARQATVRQLLGHVSGLRDVHDLLWTFSGTGHAVSSADLVAQYRSISDANAQPGITWTYNNGGYLLVSAAIERIADRPLEDVLRERIFAPAGMFDTALRRTDTDFCPHSATLHMSHPVRGYERRYFGNALAGEAGVVSTVDDLLRWQRQLANPSIGSATTWALMTTAQQLVNGTSTGYGLGLIRGRRRGIVSFEHGGGLMGGSAYMLTIPALGLDVVALVNRHDVLASALIDRIVDACLPGPSSYPLRDAVPMEGVYRSPRTSRVIQLFRRDGRQIASIDGFDLPVVCACDGSLRPDSPFGFKQQTFELIDPPEVPPALRFHDFGTTDELTRLSPPADGASSVLEGEYRAETTGTCARLEVVDGRTWLTTRGWFGSAMFDLEQLADRIWRARSVDAPLGAGIRWGGVLTFSEDAGGFAFSSERTLALPFVRER